MKFIANYLLANYKPRYQTALDLIFIKRIVIPLQRNWRQSHFTWDRFHNLYYHVELF